MRYVISDTHLGHDNIRKYCNRPHDTVEEMNERLVTDWNNIVNEDDAVIHVGDVCHHPSPLDTGQWLRKLNGNILLVRGNHDGDVPQNPKGYNVVESCTISHGKWKFYVEHYQVDEDIWSIGGHLHNNNIRKYPFINYENKTINVSVELINYAPLALDELVRILDERRSYNSLQNARDDIGL